MLPNCWYLLHESLVSVSVAGRSLFCVSQKDPVQNSFRYALRAACASSAILLPFSEGVRNKFFVMSGEWEAIGHQLLQWANKGVENRPDKQQQQCAACFSTEQGKRFTCACNHVYCAHCLAKMFSVATQNPFLLPVKCCGIPIDQRLCYDVLPIASAQQYHTALDINLHGRLLHW